MLKQVSLIILAAFWISMNLLLWKSEFRGAAELGSPVPVEVVWEKILTAPDNSPLEILRHGKKIGYCRWIPNVGEDLSTGKISSERFQPEGRVERLTGYTIDLEGSFLSEDAGARIQFDSHTSFGADLVWQEFRARSTMRPLTWQLKADAAARNFTLISEEEGFVWQRTIGFDDLRNPSEFLNELGVPLPPELFLLPGGTLPELNLSKFFSWEARHDWLRIGHSQVRIYRLQLRFLDSFRADILVSRVGEILRIELPQNVVLVHEALQNL
jgi:hypothetical protein